MLDNQIILLEVQTPSQQPLVLIWFIAHFSGLFEPTILWFLCFVAASALGNFPRGSSFARTSTQPSHVHSFCRRSMCIRSLILQGRIYSQYFDWYSLRSLFLQGGIFTKLLEWFYIR